MNRLGVWSGVALVIPAAVLGAAVVVPGVTLADWLLAAGPRWDAAQWLGALGSTIWLSVAAALAATAAALPLGVLAARYRGRATRTLEGASYVAHGLPSIVIAIAMVSLGVLLVRPIYQREPLLILAYTVLFVPLAIGSVRAAVEAAPVRLEEVARSLGRTPLHAFGTVTAEGGAAGDCCRRCAGAAHLHEGTTGDSAAASQRHRHPGHPPVGLQLGQRLRCGSAVCGGPAGVRGSADSGAGNVEHRRGRSPW